MHSWRSRGNESENTYVSCIDRANFTPQVVFVCNHRAGVSAVSYRKTRIPYLFSVFFPYLGQTTAREIGFGLYFLYTEVLRDRSQGYFWCTQGVRDRGFSAGFGLGSGAVVGVCVCLSRAVCSWGWSGDGVRARAVCCGSQASLGWRLAGSGEGGRVRLAPHGLAALALRRTPFKRS